MDLRGRLRRGWMAAAGLAAVALLTWQPAEISDGWMYAATGRWIVDNRAVPYHDTMTWTFTGGSWQSNGWLFGVLLWALMTAGGYAAYAAVKPVATVLIGLSTRWTALQYGASRTGAALGMIAGPLLVVGFILERPQLATFIFTPLVLGVGRRAIGSSRMSWPWAVALVASFAVWANLHSGALFGVLLLGSGILGILLEERFWRDSRRWPRLLEAVLLAVGATVGTLLTPYGVELWRYSNHVRSVSSEFASEWLPPWRQDVTVMLLTFALIAAVLAAVLVLRAWRRLDVAVPVLFSVVLALQAFRNAAPLALVACALLPVCLPPELVESVRRRRDLRRVGAVAALAIGLVVGLNGAWASRDPGSTIPAAAVASLPSGCRLANDSYFGNWVLWSRDDVPTSVDGRNDLYGRDLTTVYWFKTEGDQAPVLADFASEGVDCVLAQPGSPIAEALQAAGWQSLARDAGAIALASPRNPIGG